MYAELIGDYKKYRIKSLYDNNKPMGPVQGGSVSNLKAGYDVFCTGTTGIKITDVSRTGEWIMDAE